MKFIFECDVHGVECGHDVEWCAEMWCRGGFDAKCGVMSVYVKCGAM